MTIKSSLDALSNMVVRQQKTGAKKLVSAGISGADDGTIQGIMENIPTGGGVEVVGEEFSSCPLSENIYISA